MVDGGERDCDAADWAYFIPWPLRPRRTNHSIPLFHSWTCIVSGANFRAQYLDSACRSFESERMKSADRWTASKCVP